MNLHRSKAAKTAASVAALAILIGPSAAGAWAQESPAPSPSPTAAPTDEAAEDAAHDDGKHRPTVPKDNTFALGQSMQIRVNADGEQNAKMVNFRWSVSHLTVQGPPDGSKDGEYVVPVPEAGTLPRYLENFGFIHVEDGYGQWDMNVENGWDTQRSVSIYPQDWTPNISLKTEFTLDGEPVKAQDIVGKDGLVTATYTLINNTTKPYDLTVKNIDGADVQTTAEGDSPMVAITKTLLPQRYIGLNTGAGIFGADGRGNNQVQWISLPFKPLAENSQASFGWAAYVTDAVIPSLLTQVSPLYIPPHDPEAEPAEEEEAASSSNPIPLDPAIAEIQAGLADITNGLCSLTGCTEPETPDEGCETPSGPSNDKLVCLDQTLGQIISFVVAGVSAPLQTALQSISDTLGLVGTQVDLTQEEADARVATFQADAAAFPEGGTCNTAGDAAAIADCKKKDAILDVAASITAAQWMGLNDQLVAEIQAEISAKLTEAGVPIPPGTTVQGFIDGLIVSLQNFETPDLLPTTAEAQEQLLANGGQQVRDGMAQLSGGVSQAKTIIAAYVSEAVSEVQAAIAAGKTTANDALIHLRGSIGALKAAAAESPLIYGPLPPGTPEGTVLAGAYEFRIDAADNNHPYTLPRILVGLIALIAAGFAVKYLGNRNTVA